MNAKAIAMLVGSVTALVLPLTPVQARGLSIFQPERGDSGFVVDTKVVRSQRGWFGLSSHKSPFMDPPGQGNTPGNRGNEGSSNNFGFTGPPFEISGFPDVDFPDFPDIDLQGSPRGPKGPRPPHDRSPS